MPVYGGVVMGNYTDLTRELIAKEESSGRYDAINPTDVVSIGIFQWYGARALNVAREIAAADPDGAIAASGASGLYEEITSGNNNIWNGWKPSGEKKEALTNLLRLSVSEGVQNNQANKDIEGYTAQAISRGVSDPAAQMYFSDLYNQSPKQAGNIVVAVKAAGKALTVENLHAYAMQNSVMSKYSSRRNRVFNQILSWIEDGSITGGLEPSPPPVNPPNENSPSGIGGNIPPSVYGVQDMIYIMNGNMIKVDSNFPMGRMYVEVSPGIWVPLGIGGDRA